MLEERIDSLFVTHFKEVTKNELHGLIKDFDIGSEKIMVDRLIASMEYSEWKREVDKLPKPERKLKNKKKFKWGLRDD